MSEAQECITIPGSGGTSTLSAGLYPGDYFLN